MRIEARDIALVASAVRRLGSDRTIVTEMAKEIRRAVPPIRAAVKASAVAVLPARGGLGRWVARATLTARVRRSATTAGVALVDGRNSAGGRTDMKGFNAGATRHPYWGDRSHWAPQTVPAGFFDRAIETVGVSAFEDAVSTAVEHAASKVVHGG